MWFLILLIVINSNIYLVLMALLKIIYMCKMWPILYFFQRIFSASSFRSFQLGVHRLSNHISKEFIDQIQKGCTLDGKNTSLFLQTSNWKFAFPSLYKSRQQITTLLTVLWRSPQKSGIFFNVFFYLALLSLTCSVQDLHCLTWGLSSWRTRSLVMAFRLSRCSVGLVVLQHVGSPAGIRLASPAL